MTSIYASFSLQKQKKSFNFKCTIPAQGITGIFGPSGSGKTSFLRCIAGLEAVDNGVFYIDKRCLEDSEKNIYLPTHKRSIGFVFQDGELFQHLTVKKNLEYGLKRAEKSHANFHQIVDWLAIEPLLNSSTATLSGGEVQRIAIARALLSSPDLLLMDEPISSLDECAKNEVLTCLEKLQKKINIPILYVTHSIKELKRLAQYVVLINDGQVTDSGKACEIIPRLEPTQNNVKHTLIMTELISHDEKYQLSCVRFAAGYIYIPKLAKSVGERVQLQIRADEVIINLTKPESSSILNGYEAVIIEINTENSHSSTLKLDVSGEMILASISHKATKLLKLTQGLKLFIQFNARHYV